MKQKEEQTLVTFESLPLRKLASSLISAFIDMALKPKIETKESHRGLTPQAEWLRSTLCLEHAIKPWGATYQNSMGICVTQKDVDSKICPASARTVQNDAIIPYIMERIARILAVSERPSSKSEFGRIFPFINLDENAFSKYAEIVGYLSLEGTCGSIKWHLTHWPGEGLWRYHDQYIICKPASVTVRNLRISEQIAAGMTGKDLSQLIDHPLAQNQIVQKVSPVFREDGRVTFRTLHYP